MNCQKIVQKYLKKSGYAGLVSDDCFCETEHIGVCKCIGDCVPAKEVKVQDDDGDWSFQLVPVEDDELKAV